MSKNLNQSFQSHRRFRPIYHYILFPIVMILWVASFVNMIIDSFTLSSIILLGLAICAFILTLIVRSFATDLQDRIIQQEENFRHYVLTGKQLDAQLGISQIIALRFSSDEQFPELCTKAVESGMNSTAIKQSITSWRADHYRV